MGEVIRGILIPVLGTTLGASFAYWFMKKMMNKMALQVPLTGCFAVGIMVSASVWSFVYTVNGLCGGKGTLGI